MDENNSDRLESLWNDCYSRLLGFIASRVNDPAEAEDILQEVFIRIHNHLCCLPEPARLDGWIYQIARNLVIDHYRSRRETVEIPESLPAESEIFFEEDLQTELAFSLKEMVEELPEPYRTALVLTDLQGVSQKELAERLGLSPSGAKSRVQRAREKLRDMLLTCCHVELDRRGRVIDYYARCCCCNPA